jgi:hypothetical protein
MRSLKFETPRVATQPRLPTPEKVATTPSKGIVPSAPKPVAKDGFEKARLPGKIGGGSTFDPAGSGMTKTSSLAYIGASGTKPQGGELSRAVMDRLDQSAADIFSRLGDLTHPQVKKEIWSAVNGLELGSRSEIRLAKKYLRTQISKLASSGSGASGNKPFGAELYSSRPVDSGAFPSTSPSTSTPRSPKPGTSRAPVPHRADLKDLARRLAGNPALKTDTQVRKAAWAEIKKLGLSETASQQARSFVLEQLAAHRR